MGLFRRRASASRPGPRARPDPPAPTPELLAVVDRLARPCLRLRPRDVPPPGAGQSQVGGHPAWPVDAEPWPTWAGLPMAFLLQVDLAQATAAAQEAGQPLPGLPERGMLQWFVGADDALGLGDGGLAPRGFAVRWYADGAPPSLRAPDEPTPWHQAREDGLDPAFPLYDDEVRALDLVGGRCLPWHQVLTDDDRAVIEAWGRTGDLEAHEADDLWVSVLLEEGGPFASMCPGSTLGGWPRFLQEDPRGGPGYPDLDDPAGAHLLQLTDPEFPGWADVGSGHLFGDLHDLARGDTGSLTYHWEC